jgi:hypothetical protein
VIDGSGHSAKGDGVNIEQQMIANGLMTAVVTVDLQLYKGSIYKLRWGSPGGLDEAIPSYQEAKRTIDETPWPDELRETATDLAQRIDRYVRTLQVQDVTSASGQHSQMMATFAALRDQVRAWPNGGRASSPGKAGPGHAGSH